VLWPLLQGISADPLNAVLSVDQCCVGLRSRRRRRRIDVRKTRYLANNVERIIVVTNNVRNLSQELERN